MLRLWPRPRGQRSPFSGTVEPRLRALRWGGAALILIILVRLFFLQVINHRYYTALAAERHGFEMRLPAKRGRIYLRDLKNKTELYPLAINQDFFMVFADPALIKEPKIAAKIIAKKLDLNESELLNKLSVTSTHYVVLKKQVPAPLVDQLKLEGLNAVGFQGESRRFYPEANLAAQIAGFYGFDNDGKPRGKYGLEGFFDEQLSGRAGYLASEAAARGAPIPLAPKEFQPSWDGDDLILTIDRSLEFFVCDKLRRGLKEYEAEKALAVIIEPKSGAILAMCDEPSFDLNRYAEVKDQSLFNNDVIFTPYEPGSVFKAITMAGAIDAGKVTPETTYIDKGALRHDGFTIRNAADKVYGEQNMIGVLQESINTGAVFAAEALGRDLFKKYVQNFGFGSLTGIELKSEVAGNINSLNKKGGIYLATASFGQGLTTTPLQLVTAFSVFANGGKLMKPYIVAEVRKSDGGVIKTEPTEIRQVISSRTAKLINGMLAVVVREGHAKKAQVAGYTLAGKTGTAEIPDFESGGYTEETEQTFIGYGPIDDPRFVILVKFSKPQRRFAEYTAVPVFGEIADFMLKYLEVPN